MLLTGVLCSSHTRSGGLLRVTRVTESCDYDTSAGLSFRVRFAMEEEPEFSIGAMKWVPLN